MSVKHFTAISCICLLVLFFTVENLWAGVSIAPAFVEVSLDKKKPSGRFIIRNTGTETERFRIRASHFTFDNNGELTKTEPDENSLAPWIKFNPKEFSLPPKTNRAIRYIIIPKGKLESKEYWGFMELQSLKANIAKTKAKDGRSMKLSITPTILVPIFATKGDVSYSASLTQSRVELREKRLVIDTIVNNTGKGHLIMDGDFEFLDNSGQVIEKGALGKNYILPGGKRRYRGFIKTELPNGNYTVNIAFSDPNLKETVKSSFDYSR